MTPRVRWNGSIRSDQNPSPLVEDPAKFYRSWERFDFLNGLFIFFHVEENEPKEDARVPLLPARR